MAITAYTGLVGSGKSYEVVLNVILPALRDGRRVVTNVAGLQVDAIMEYIVANLDGDADALGTIVQVSHARVGEPDFFPAEAIEGQPLNESVVVGGDLVVIDECWRWWASDSKLSVEHMTFFRMHRHFVHAETLTTCDLVLVSQDVGDLHRKLKAVVETTFVMTKHKALGSSKRYRVDVYPKAKVSSRAAKIREMQRSYDPAVFALYKSYSQSVSGGGKEEAADKRTNIWSGALFSIFVPGTLLLACVSGFFLWRFLHPSTPEKAKASTAADARSTTVASDHASSATEESEWRVKGHYYVNQIHRVVLVRRDAYLVLLNPPGFFYDGLYVVGNYKGKIVSNFTGEDAPLRSQQMLGQGLVK